MGSQAIIDLIKDYTFHNEKAISRKEFTDGGVQLPQQLRPALPLRQDHRQQQHILELYYLHLQQLVPPQLSVTGAQASSR